MASITEARQRREASERFLLAQLAAEYPEPNAQANYITEWPPAVYPGEGKPYPLDNQRGAAELLAKITAAPLAAFEEAAMDTYGELLDLLVSKQSDYGPHSVNNAPGGALNGINVRLHDKLQRILHLSETDVPSFHEPLRDSYRDLANYAVIALMVIDGSWPE